MNTEQEDDYKILASLCRSHGVHPDGDLAPNLRAIAREDRDLRGKVEKLARELRENMAKQRLEQ